MKISAPFSVVCNRLVTPLLFYTFFFKKILSNLLYFFLFLYSAFLFFAIFRLCDLLLA
jgi:hypothetical protein